MTRRACAPSSDDLAFFFDGWHAPLAEPRRRWRWSRPEDREDPLAIAEVLASTGLLRACVPSSVGGLRAHHPDAIDVRAVCLVREALGWGSGLLDTVFAMQGLGSYPIVLAGTPAQREEYLPAVLRGESLAAFAITEPEAGTDVSALSTVARREGDEWVLDGEKTFISNAGIAGHYVVFANADPAKGRKGITGFLVLPTDPGFVFKGHIPMMADHPIGTIRVRGLSVER